MITIYGETHTGNFGKSELIDGVFHESFECPERADQILATPRERSFGPVIDPVDYGLSSLASMHDPQYVEFLRVVWERWAVEGNSFYMLSLLASSEVGRRNPRSNNIIAQMGYYRHADSVFDYPFYMGFSDERGAGKGEGFNFNYTLAENTAWAQWSEALVECAHEN